MTFFAATEIDNIMSMYSRLNQGTQTNVTAMFDNYLGLLSVYCNSHGCQIRFGNDLMLMQFSSKFFNCSSNDGMSCSLDFSEAQMVLKALVANGDSFFLTKWLKIGCGEKAMYQNNYYVDTDSSNHQRRYFFFKMSLMLGISSLITMAKS